MTWARLGAILCVTAGAMAFVMGLATLLSAPDVVATTGVTVVAFAGACVIYQTGRQGGPPSR